MANNYNLSTGVNLPTDKSIFLATNAFDGCVFLDLAFTTLHTVEELHAKIGTAAGVKVSGPGYYRSNLEDAIHIEHILDLGTHRQVELYTMCSPSTSHALNAVVKSAPYKRERNEGEYDINITHWFLNVKGDINQIEFYRNTESFNKLIPEMYPKIHIEEMMKQFSISDESILILSGKPGTGKTCVAKLMMKAHAITSQKDINVVYVKDRDVLRLDRFWTSMSSMEPDMIILDDLDNELLPRGPEGNPIVSNMLSYSDGIFDMETKILITTNLTDSLIDKALVRPGRSFDTLCLPQLEREEARSIWLTKFKAPLEEFTSRFGSMPIISQAALMSEYQRFTKSGSPSYLLDPSISIRKLVEEGDTINHEDSVK